MAIMGEGRSTLVSLNKGGPAAPELEGFMQALNAVFGDSSQQTAVANALERDDGDLRSLLEDLTGLPIPEHIEHFLSQAGPYQAMLIGAARSFANGDANTITVDSFNAPNMPDLSVTVMDDGGLSLIFREIA